MARNQEQLTLTETLRRRFPNVGQRTFARILDDANYEALPGYALLPLAEQNDLAEQVKSAGGWQGPGSAPTPGFATIYGRVRRIDAAIAAETPEPASV